MNSQGFSFELPTLPLLYAAYLNSANQIRNSSYSFPLASSSQKSAFLAKRNFNTLADTESLPLDKKVKNSPSPFVYNDKTGPIIPTPIHASYQRVPIVLQPQHQTTNNPMSELASQLQVQAKNLLEAQQAQNLMRIFEIQTQANKPATSKDNEKLVHAKSAEVEQEVSERDDCSIQTTQEGTKHPGTPATSLPDIDQKHSLIDHLGDSKATDGLTNESSNNKSSEPIVEPPALTVLTKEFPDWDLGKIAEFLNDGKTKDDLVHRDLRNNKNESEKIEIKKEKMDEEEEFVSDEEVNQMMNEFNRKLREIFKCSEINQEKVYATLCKNNFELRKAVTLVKKNTAFYRKYFCIDNSASL